MKKNATLTVFLIMIFLIGLSKCNAQSFQRARGYSTVAPEGHGKQCHAVHRQKTIGQKLRNKVRYQQKRNRSEMFNYRETRRAIKKQGFRL
jgi:hypothetical protein